MKKNKSEILEANREVGRLFERAYRYLRAAAAVYEDMAVINGWAAEEGKINRLGYELVSELFKDCMPSVRLGKQRKLFASAITPDGLKNYLGSLLDGAKVYVIDEVPGCMSDRILETVRSAAVGRGYDVECYYCALMPDKLEHLLIPGIGTAFTTSNACHHTDVHPYRRIDLPAYLDIGVTYKYKNEMNYNSLIFNELLDKSIETISKAKVVHDNMEKYYVPNMDFDAVQRCWEATLVRILEYTGE